MKNLFATTVVFLVLFVFGSSVAFAQQTPTQPANTPVDRPDHTPAQQPRVVTHYKIRYVGVVDSKTKNTINNIDVTTGDTNAISRDTNKVSKDSLETNKETLKVVRELKDGQDNKSSSDFYWNLSIVILLVILGLIVVVGFVLGTVVLIFGLGAVTAFLRYCFNGSFATLNTAMTNGFQNAETNANNRRNDIVGAVTSALDQLLDNSVAESDRVITAVNAQGDSVRQAVAGEGNRTRRFVHRTARRTQQLGGNALYQQINQQRIANNQDPIPVRLIERRGDRRRQAQVNVTTTNAANENAANN